VWSEANIFWPFSFPSHTFISFDALLYPFQTGQEV